ncbi:hypothetical protein M5D96_002546 [Drosophila gunungcola]|uniref:Uncharacterized protein n=1 Tax=Drosophila gunungcola TaxID=103775 RepID=A0A9P9Z092_9MUSC|nr:hypothetical protein M5D96_002546 [Drosophila gunungcola]
MTTTTAPAATRTPAASGGGSGSGTASGSGNAGAGGGVGTSGGGGGGGGGALMIPGGYRGRSCSNSGCHRLTAALGGSTRKAANPPMPADKQASAPPHPAPN